MTDNINQWLLWKSFNVSQSSNKSGVSSNFSQQMWNKFQSFFWVKICQKNGSQNIYLMVRWRLPKDMKTFLQMKEIFIGFSFLAEKFPTTSFNFIAYPSFLPIFPSGHNHNTNNEEPR